MNNSDFGRLLKERISALHLLLDERMAAHKEVHGQLGHELELARNNVEMRLNAINTLRDQINTERGEYLKVEFRDYYDKKQADINEQISMLRQTFNGYITKDEFRLTAQQLDDLRGVAQTMTGRLWALGTMIAIVFAIVNVAIAYVQQTSRAAELEQIKGHIMDLDNRK